MVLTPGAPNSGERVSQKVFSDATPDDVEGLDDGQAHRGIDKKISRVAERLKGTASIRIIVRAAPPILDNGLSFRGVQLPPMIYGQGSGPFNQLSMQTPALIRAQLKYGFAGVWGTGAPIWNHVHVRDLARG